MLRMPGATYKVVGMAVLMSTFASTAYAQAIIRGKITDKWDNPIPNVRILAESLDKRRVDNPVEAVTDEKGQYVLAGLFAARYSLTYRAAGYQAIRVEIRPRSSAVGCTTNTNREDFELEATPPGGRLRGNQDYEAEGGLPKISFDDDGTFEFEDADGEGEGTYGVVELNGFLVVRDYDGPDDKYTILEEFIVTFANDQFRSFDWGDVTLAKK